MTKHAAKVYLSALPAEEPFSSLLESHSFDFVALSQEMQDRKASITDCGVILIHESVFSQNVISFLSFLSRISKRIPLIIAGYKFNQHYIEKLFKDRPFTYITIPCSIEELKTHLSDALSGSCAFMPAHDFEKELETARSDIKALHEIGIALSSENDPDKLLELILTQSRNLAEADAGSLYLMEGEHHLRFKLSQNVSLDWSVKQNALIPINGNSISGYTASSREPLNLLDAYQMPESFPFTFNKSYDHESGYRTKSMVAVPMKNKAGEVLGVIQLINKRADYETKVPGQPYDENNIRPFLYEDVELLSSLASQAAVALENSKLYQDIKKLFEGFVKASIFAIESRDPTTHGHSERVAELTIALAYEINNLNHGPLANLHFDQKKLTEIRYATLLHDFGKVGVREEILVKAKKLFPYELDSLRDRYRFIQKSIEADFYHECLNYVLEHGIDRFNLVKPSLEANFRTKMQEIQETLDFLIRSNEPSVMEDGNFQKLVDIASRQFVDLSGFMTPLLTERETHVLSIRRGSLSEAERIEIESHVRHTFKFLSKIPWTKDLSRIPEIAYAHHEKLNGRGYPNHLESKDIPVESQMLSVADIFDALTAQDRPYKPAVPLQKAVDILYFDVNQNHINRELVDLFVQKEVFRVIEGRNFR